MITREAVAARIIELCKEKDITMNGIANLSAIPHDSTMDFMMYSAIGLRHILP